MRLGDTNYYLTKTRGTDNIYYGNVFTSTKYGDTWGEVPAEYVSYAASLLETFKDKTKSDAEKLAYLEDTLSILGKPLYKNNKSNKTTFDTKEISVAEDSVAEEIEVEKIKPTFNEDELKVYIQKIINFFSEFGFEPNFRFCNTLANIAAKESSGSACNYVFNYFELAGNDYAYSIRDKMKSREWEEIVDYFNINKTSKVINTRFKLYYGSQGTGKTTEAMNESDNNVMVCHSAMLPSDLMEDFKFVKGKADFQPSALQIAMVEGKKIVLDEINLLPFESLRFLQSILDGKSEFVYKGKTIKIKEGFQIIGTMNLVVNGATYSLPEPLIDRASNLKKFKLSAGSLVGSFI